MLFRSGDGKNTVNISTSAAILTTAAGARVVKHGSIAASSKSGAADVLNALGVATDLTGPEVEKTVYKLGIGFMKATTFHSALRHAAPARKALGVPTVFNILGPLANPAKPIAIAIGVSNARMQPVMADVLARRGCEGFVFRGDDGLDELTLATTSTVFQVADGKVHSEKVDPANLGLENASIEELIGGEAAENAAITLDVLHGKQGPHRDAIVLNAAAAIAAFKADFTLSVEQQLANGIVLANQAIDSGRAKNLLEEWAKLSQEIAIKYPA